MSSQSPYNGMFDLSGTVSVITGAAGGMGFAMSAALAEFGSAVVMVDLNADALAEAESAVKQSGAVTAAIAVDVAQEDAPARILAAARELGEVDVLINNAGIMSNLTFDQVDDAAWDKMMSINLRAPMRIIREIVPTMAERKTGSIINIGSSWSSRASVFNQSGGSAQYNSAKAALQALTRSVAQEYAASNVRVNAIAPGAVDTSMHAHQRDFLYTYEKFIPLGRMQQAQDIAGAAVFLASEASSYITGQTIHVNGGLLMVD